MSNRSEFKNLPTEMVSEILKSTNYKDLKNLCNSSQTIKQLCNTKYGMKIIIDSYIKSQKIFQIKTVEHAFIHAAESGDIFIFIVLLKYKPSLLDYKDSEKLSVLHYAVMSDQKKIIEFLLKKTNISINTRDNYKNTPLHLVESKKVTEMLIENGAMVNAKNIYNQTPLQVSIGRENKKISKTLLNYGADEMVIWKL